MAVAAVGTLLNALSAAIILGLVEWLFGDDLGTRAFTGVTAAAVALPSTLVSTYCNVALLRMAPARFEGRRCSARDGFRAANRRLGPIVAWSLVATMFAVPVLALEDAGARRAARRSVEIFRARWGEGIAGTVSVGFVTIVGSVPGAILLIAGFAAGGATGVALVVAGGALLLGAMSAANALDELFALAVYRFETQGAGSFGFEPGQLDGFVDLKRNGPRR